MYNEHTPHKVMEKNLNPCNSDIRIRKTNDDVIKAIYGDERDAVQQREDGDIGRQRDGAGSVGVRDKDYEG